MTLRYRCCWCASAVAKEAKTMREHVVKRHRVALERILHPIEAFTPKEEV